MADTREQALEQAVKHWARITEQEPVEQVALISDASNREIDRLNARAQHHRLQRGELGPVEADIPGVHYGVRAGDRVALTDQHHQPGQPRFENGERGDVLDVNGMGEVTVVFDITGRQATLAGEDLANLRLAYASHIHRAQGATVTQTIVITGGWQTSKEPAYVEASRSRQATDWYVSREDLGSDGQDADRIGRLAQAMRTSRAQTPSLAHVELSRQHERRPGKLDLHIPPGRRPAGHDRDIPIAPSRRPWLARNLRRLITRTPDLTRQL